MRSPDQIAAWLEERAGVCTASRVGDVRARKKDGQYTAARANYMRDLMVERSADGSVRHFVSNEMQWGIDHEDEAANFYEATTGTILTDPWEELALGIAKHPTIECFSASPDRLIGRDGLLQIKCPTTATHMAWQIAGVVPPEYHDQLLAELACTGRRYNIFCSYDPRIRDERRRIFVRKFEPDPKLIAACEADVAAFVAELEKAWDQYITATR